MLKGNPSFTLKKEKGNVRIYILTNPMELHATRYVEVLNQQIYASAGATREVLQTAIDEILARCNDMKNAKTFRTDMTAIAQSLQYRLNYPVDQHCAIRMGAACSFYEEDVEVKANISTTQEVVVEKKTVFEDAKQYDGFWQQKKELLAFSDPDWYSFFLTWGIVNTPQYNNLLDTLNDTGYFVKREIMIQSLFPLKNQNPSEQQNNS